MQEKEQKLSEMLAEQCKSIEDIQELLKWISKSRWMECLKPR